MTRFQEALKMYDRPASGRGSVCLRGTGTGRNNVVVRSRESEVVEMIVLECEGRGEAVEAVEDAPCHMHVLFIR